MKNKEVIVTNYQIFTIEQAEEEFKELVSQSNWETWLDYFTDPDLASQVHAFYENEGYLIVCHDDDCDEEYIITNRNDAEIIRKKDKLFMHWKSICENETNNNLTELNYIYEDYNSPRNNSPKRIMNLKWAKGLIECSIRLHNMEVEKVVEYKDQWIFANKTLSVYYLSKLDPYNSSLLGSLMLKNDQRLLNEYEEYLRKTEVYNNN